MTNNLASVGADRNMCWPRCLLWLIGLQALKWKWTDQKDSVCTCSN